MTSPATEQRTKSEENYCLPQLFHHNLGRTGGASLAWVHSEALPPEKSGGSYSKEKIEVFSISIKHMAIEGA